MAFACGRCKAATTTRWSSVHCLTLTTVASGHMVQAMEVDNGGAAGDHRPGIPDDDELYTAFDPVRASKLVVALWVKWQAATPPKDRIQTNSCFPWFFARRKSCSPPSGEMCTSCRMACGSTYCGWVARDGHIRMTPSLADWGLGTWGVGCTSTRASGGSIGPAPTVVRK